MAELAFGVAKSGPGRNAAELRQLLEPLFVADFDGAAAARYATLRAALEAAGTPIGPLDTQIAAHALALDRTIPAAAVRARSTGPPRQRQQEARWI